MEVHKYFSIDGPNDLRTVVGRVSDDLAHSNHPLELEIAKNLDAILHLTEVIEIDWERR